jgi:putative resolvase
MEIEPKVLKLTKAAKILDVTPQAIILWEKAGKIRCIRSPGGRRMVPMEEINRIITGGQL